MATHKKYFIAATLMLAIILLMALASCHVAKEQRQITMTVTHVERGDSINEVMVRRGYQYWMGECKTIPELLKIGDKMIASFTNIKDTACNCFFKRIK